MKRFVNSPMVRLTFLFVLLVSGRAATADEGPDNFDILGFRLGMTQEEAEAVFRHLNPDVELQVRHATYRYSDGLQNHETEPFLDQIRGVLRYDPATQSVLDVTVEFSPPPDGGRVMQITRNDSKIANPVTLAEYQGALIGKYGEPAASRYGLQWHFPSGRELCSTSANGPVVSHLSSLAQGRDRDEKLANPSRCASYLTFRMTGDPVRDVYARMVDVEEAIRTHLAASAWVGELEAEAVARRKAAGRGPEL